MHVALFPVVDLLILYVLKKLIEVMGIIDNGVVRKPLFII